MAGSRRYALEFLLTATILVLSILGFWGVYFGEESNPRPHHHLHLATVFAWTGLMFLQLVLLGRGSYRSHRRVGLAILLAGPALGASSALLAVHSAHEGVVSGEGDFLIVQNLTATVMLGAHIPLAFLVGKNRKLHAAFLLSTLILFMGPALFFVMIGYLPKFRIEGPDPTVKFMAAGLTGQAIILAVGLLFLVRNYRANWPIMLAAASFPLADAISRGLARLDLIDPLTSLVGSISKPITFAVAFALMAWVLAAATLRPARRRRDIPFQRKPAPGRIQPPEPVTR